MGVNWWRCDSDGSPPVQVQSAIDAQVAVVTFTSFTENGFTQQLTDFDRIVIAGVAVGNADTDFDAEIRARYGTDQYGPLNLSQAAASGDSTIVGFSAERYEVREGTPTAIGGIQAIPFAGGGNQNIGIRVTHPVVSTSNDCGVTVNQTETVTFTAGGSPTSSSSSRDIVNTLFNVTSRERFSTSIDVVERFTDYLPSFTGSRTLCTQSAATAPGNDAAIEAALLNDPLRRCKGCGQ